MTLLSEPVIAVSRLSPFRRLRPMNCEVDPVYLHRQLQLGTDALSKRDKSADVDRTTVSEMYQLRERAAARVLPLCTADLEQSHQARTELKCVLHHLLPIFRLIETSSFFNADFFSLLMHYRLLII